MAPAAAVAEWPEGNELEEGVFMSGATSVSRIKGRARSKRCLAPSATNHDPATAAHGTSRHETSVESSTRPAATTTTRRAAAAKNPHRAPAVPAIVEGRIRRVK